MEEEESYVETFQDVSGEKDHQRHSEDVSELVSVGGFKAGCSEVYPQVSCDPLQGASRQEVATYMGVTDEVFQQVETSCRYLARSCKVHGHRTNQEGNHRPVTKPRGTQRATNTV